MDSIFCRGPAVVSTLGLFLGTVLSHRKDVLLGKNAISISAWALSVSLHLCVHVINLRLSCVEALHENDL